jgi:hypothetical protein
MPSFDEKIYWQTKSISSPFEFANNFERSKTFSDSLSLARILATNNGQSKPAGTTLTDFLKVKKENAWSEDIARFPGTIDEQQEYANSIGILNDEETAIFSNISNRETPLKFLELYFNAYMAPSQSDIKWRLGEVTGMYMPTEGEHQGLIDSEGRMYTRTNFNSGLRVKFWNGETGAGVCEQGQYYANLSFPPFKIGADNPMSQKTYIMSGDDLPDGVSFDQDKFLVKREGFTYRDPGFKALNDNINFLQWALERATGIVSTYLTEWDLSVYMQEGMMGIDPNGGTAKIWLNYRVRQDNPLATTKQGYTGDRALCFNVLGSAVSKIDFDNLKYWRPSDHPLSPYWMPYTKDYDWKIKWAEIHDDEVGTHDKIPYMSVYDESPTYSYNRKPLKDIIQHQDYMGICVSGWKSMDLQYYQTLYTLESEALSETDLRMKKYVEKTAGAEPGKSSPYDLFHMKNEEWANMIASGGYIGADGPAGMDGTGGAASVKSKKAQFLKWMMNGADMSVADDGADAVQQLNQSLAGAAGMAQDMLGPGPSPGEGSGKGGKITAQDIKDAKRKQASTMACMTGLNRFSPALYGGPHGSSYSPLTIQGYFDTHNKALRNTPRISDNDAVDFTSEFKFDLYEGNNAFYYNGTNNSCSPTKSLHIVHDGIYGWTPAYGLFLTRTTKLIKGTVVFRKGIFGNPWTEYIFPASEDGGVVTYEGGYEFKAESTWKPGTLWDYDNNDWWDNYYSYFNYFSIRKIKYVNGEMGWLTTTQQVYRMGSFTHYTSRQYKKYLLHDEPAVNWSITTHKCLKWKTDGSWSGPYWKMLRGLFDRINIRNKYILYVSQDTLFKLNIKDADAEQRVIKYMIMSGRGMNAKSPIFFLGGNTAGRFKTGPEFIFQANCTVENYTTETKIMKPKIVFPTSFFNFKLPRITYEYVSEYTQVPFISVEMNRMDLPFWADKLNVMAYSNEQKGTSDKPLQFESVPSFTEMVVPADDPLLKFKGGFNESFYSGYEESLQETIRRRIKIDPSRMVADYPNPEYLVDKPRARTGLSKFPNTKTPTKFNGESQPYDGTMISNSLFKFIESLADKGNYKPVATDIWAEELKYEEGDLDVLYHYVRYPMDFETSSLQGQLVYINGKKIPWCMEVVYERQDNSDIETYQIDTGHLQSEIAGLGKDKGGSPLFPQGYVENSGKILRSVKYYACDFDPDYIFVKKNGAGLNIDDFLKGGEYDIKYIPHYKSYLDVTREKDEQSSRNDRDYVIPKDLWSGDEITRGKYDWRSVGTSGIKGIGLLSSLPGLFPVVEDSAFENFSQYLKKDVNTLINVPLEDLPWKTRFVTTERIKTEKTADNVEFIPEGGSFDYGEKDMDPGLKRAIATLATRGTFFRIDAPAMPNYIDLGVPFRVLLNICLTQHSYLGILKEMLLDSVEFDTLYQMIDDCVDKCVSKACGWYTPEDPEEKPYGDQAHLLYDYWLEEIIKLVRDKTQHSKNRQLVEAAFNERLTKLQWAIDVLSGMSKGYARSWTWKQILTSYDVLKTLKIESQQVTLVEKFIMGYIHILYYYRLFFIGKRFNKQDGTMWIMRALESILNFVAPYSENDNPPPSPMKMMKKDPAYKVAFVELQNTFSAKQAAVINKTQLDYDRVRVCYVQVEWSNRKAYDAYNNWRLFPDKYPEAPEIVKITHNGKRMYARKPIDGEYSLISNEILTRDKDIKFNNTHPDDMPRIIPDFDIAKWWIDWGDETALTPIRWGVFVNLDPDKLIEYVDGSISPEELVCLCQVGSDFWTVRVPETQWPKVVGLKTRVKLKHYDPVLPVDTLRGDAYVAILGSQAYSLWPITEKQTAPNPGVVLTPGQKTAGNDFINSYI